MNDDDAIADFVDASARALELPIAAGYRATVITVMERIAAYAADVAAFGLADDVEIAAAFTP